MSDEKSFCDSQYDTLNETERRVLDLFLSGRTDREISEIVPLERTNVRGCISNICTTFLGARKSGKTDKNSPRRNELFNYIARYKPDLIKPNLKIEVLKKYTGFEVVLHGDLKNLTLDQRRALEQEVQKIAKELDLIVVKIKSGSIIIEFEGSPEGFERIKALFDSGELTEVAGFAIQEISALPEQQTQRTQLREWLQGVFAPLWESVDGLLTTEQPSFAFRQRSEGVSRRKTIVFNELEDCQVEMVATIIPLERPKVKVIIQILPSPGASHLPEDLRIQLLDESDADNPEGEIFDAKENLEFNVEEGDAFSIIVEQGRYRVVERFMV
ncbi:hypothetical protein BI308_01500 [Roseofilum reptotaenium AO1-A]|uniref:TRADD-like N-terminal domain-containing protein n=1 Tax=Roseofilum reptotaenium AO1-A TaxID=1925591 RepID=A0A1L9QWX2_9CYAN|nr:hypothetical protein BI308_01500 [Roseofilum reptotaenium AO1-A]